MRRRDGVAAVLKVNFPEPESELEADALAHWDGRGAVCLLDRDDDRRLEYAHVECAQLLAKISP